MSIKLILISTLLFANLAWADEESLRAEIEALRKQLLETQDRVAKLETTTSLLMAGYQSEREREVYKEHNFKEVK